MAERVLVCGGRDYDDGGAVGATLCALNAEMGIAVIIEGGARGADRLARQWAECAGVPYLTVDADWKKYGKAAGAIRNAEMLKQEPTLVVAFPGGRGTADMVRRARAANVEVIEVAAAASSGSPSVPLVEGRGPQG